MGYVTYDSQTLKTYLILQVGLCLFFYMEDDKMVSIVLQKLWGSLATRTGLKASHDTNKKYASKEIDDWTLFNDTDEYH